MYGFTDPVTNLASLWALYVLASVHAFVAIECSSDSLGPVGIASSAESFESVPT
jgi:hypothetical protein